MTGLPLNIDVQQIVLHMLNFVILVGGLYIILYKPVKDFMEKREEFFKNKAEAADEILANAKDKEKEYNDKLAKADEEIAELKNKAAQAAKDASQKKLDEASAEAAKILSEARINAEREHDKMIASAKMEIADLATEAAEKIIKEQGDAYDSFAAAAKN